MKFKISCCFAILLLTSLIACGGKWETEAAASEKTAPAENTGKILIAWFSQSDIVSEGADAVSSATPFTGNTESAALEIQKQTGGDLFAIRTVKTYPVSHSECSSIAEEEMKADARPELSSHVEDFRSYDVIYLGYPIWWHGEPMAIRSFLEEYDFSGKTIIPFCTSLGVDISESEDHIRTLCPDSTVLSGLSLPTGQDSFTETISEWLAGHAAIMTHTKPEDSTMKIKITVGNTELTATLENNATTRAIAEQMPVTLPMMDLYGREMCYRYGAYALPTDHLQSDGYEIGDIAYWAPGGSLVILYKQNGEHFERQHLGHIDSGVEVFDHIGDVDVTFEIME